MKKTVITLLIGCAVLTGTSSAFAATATVEKTVNFRSAPSTSSSTYGFLKSGTKLTVLQTVDTYWLKVKADGKTGYVSTDYVGKISGTIPKPDVSGSRIVATAKNYIGDFKYKLGAEPWNTSYKYSDCSSFVQLVFNHKHGFNLPRTSYAQSKEGRYVSKSSLKAGDLVFFDTNNDGKINHVGIYIGDGKFIHSSPINQVGTSDLTKGYWKDHYKTARRVI